MRSIRRRLLVWLSLWLLLLSVVAVVAMVAAFRRSLVAEFDRELIPELANAQLILRPGPRGFNDPANRNEDIFVQAWDSDSRNTLYKSENLGRRSLPFLDIEPRETEHGDATLSDGLKVRVAATGILTFTSGASPETGNPVVVAVARDRSSLERAVVHLFLVSGLVGLVGIAAAGAIAVWAMARGLQPLESVGDRVDRIDANSLTERLDTTGMPRELLPFANRINDLLGRLEEGFDRERRFSSDLSHELRTPIAEIRSTAEFALRFPDRAAPGDYESIFESTQKLEQIVETQLNLARLETGIEASEAIEIDLPETTRDMIDTVKGRAEERGLRWKLDLAEGRKVSASPGLMRTILGNLVNNAVEYAPEGAEVEVQIPEAGDWFVIRNEAPGLELEDIGRMFDRLWRKDSSRSAGTRFGLGLSLSRAAARAMGKEVLADLGNGILTMKVADKRLLSA